MKLTTRSMIVDKYGMRVTMDQLAEILDVTPHTIYNLIGTNELPIRTYKEGKRRFASYEAVADYLDAKDDEAAKEMGKKKPER
jgi:hypothetical protein